ncbi:MAG: PQQ-dependent sugar dehydrogenase [Candidatus Sumerlaeaceae bacterium]
MRKPCFFRSTETLLVALALLTVGVCHAQDASIPPKADSGNATASGIVYYQNYCANCHGGKLEGGNGGGLRAPSDFQHGFEPDAVFRSIRNGIPDLGMPAYGATLTDEQINALVAVIKNPQQQPSSTTTTTTQSIRERTKLRTLDYEVRVEVWADGLTTPWAIDFLDARNALVTERSGPVRIITDGKLLPEPVSGTPKAWENGQGGMMDVAVDPDYAKNGWVYLGYSEPGGGSGMTRIVRGKLRDAMWVDEQVVWQAGKEHYTKSGIHFGCRIVFGPDGKLYFSVGERGSQQKAQDLSMPNGKIYRLNTDGTIPVDNPFANRHGTFPGIFSYGHRNPQGLSFHPVTGELWDVEHGPRGGDELNLVRAGQNYGWPLITYGINYDGKILTRERVRPGLSQPIHYWRPSIAVAGAEFYTGDLFPYWRNHLLVTSLADKDLRLLQIQENRVLHEEILFDNLARVREAVTGPDGAIYVVINEPGEILRLTPIQEKPI